MTTTRYDAFHALFKVLGSATRLRILELLLDAPKGKCVHEIAAALRMSHSATSHQLSKLEAHHIVNPLRTGQSMCYQLSPSGNARLIKNILRQCRETASK